jgi:hypothetical protein
MCHQIHCLLENTSILAIKLNIYFILQLKTKIFKSKMYVTDVSSIYSKLKDITQI